MKINVKNKYHKILIRKFIGRWYYHKQKVVYRHNNYGLFIRCSVYSTVSSTAGYAVNGCEYQKRWTLLTEFNGSSLRINFILNFNAW